MAAKSKVWREAQAKQARQEAAAQKKAERQARAKQPPGKKRGKGTRPIEQPAPVETPLVADVHMMPPADVPSPLASFPQRLAVKSRRLGVEPPAVPPKKRYLALETEAGTAVTPSTEPQTSLPLPGTMQAAHVDKAAPTQMPVLPGVVEGAESSAARGDAPASRAPGDTVEQQTAELAHSPREQGVDERPAAQPPAETLQEPPPMRETDAARPLYADTPAPETEKPATADTLPPDYERPILGRKSAMQAFIEWHKQGGDPDKFTPVVASSRGMPQVIAMYKDVQKGGTTLLGKMAHEYLSRYREGAPPSLQALSEQFGLATVPTYLRAVIKARRPLFDLTHAPLESTPELDINRPLPFQRVKKPNKTRKLAFEWYAQGGDIYDRQAGYAYFRAHGRNSAGLSSILDTFKEIEAGPTDEKSRIIHEYFMQREGGKNPDLDELIRTYDPRQSKASIRNAISKRRIYYKAYFKKHPLDNATPKASDPGAADVARVSNSSVTAPPLDVRADAPRHAPDLQAQSLSSVMLATSNQAGSADDSPHHGSDERSIGQDSGRPLDERPAAPTEPTPVAGPSHTDSAALATTDFLKAVKAHMLDWLSKGNDPLTSDPPYIGKGHGVDQVIKTWLDIKNGGSTPNAKVVDEYYRMLRNGESPNLLALAKNYDRQKNLPAIREMIRGRRAYYEAMYPNTVTQRKYKPQSTPKHAIRDLTFEYYRDGGDLDNTQAIFDYIKEHDRHPIGVKDVVRIFKEIEAGPKDNRAKIVDEYLKRSWQGNTPKLDELIAQYDPTQPKRSIRRLIRLKRPYYEAFHQRLTNQARATGAKQSASGDTLQTGQVQAPLGGEPDVASNPGQAGSEPRAEKAPLAVAPPHIADTASPIRSEPSMDEAQEQMDYLDIDNAPFPLSPQPDDSADSHLLRDNSDGLPLLGIDWQHVEADSMDIEVLPDSALPVLIKQEQPDAADAGAPRTPEAADVDGIEFILAEGTPLIKPELDTPSEPQPEFDTPTEPEPEHDTVAEAAPESQPAEAPVKEEVPVLKHVINNAAPVLQNEKGEDILREVLQKESKLKKPADLETLVERLKSTFPETFEDDMLKTFEHSDEGVPSQLARKTLIEITQAAKRLLTISHEERAAHMESLMDVVQTPDKGRGVVAKRDIKAFEVLGPYAGKWLDAAGQKREEAKIGESKLYSYSFIVPNEDAIISGFGEGHGNLTTLLNDADNPIDNNVEHMWLGKNLAFLLTKRPVPQGKHLLLDYGGKYDRSGWEGRPIKVEDDKPQDQ